MTDKEKKLSRYRAKRNSDTSPEPDDTADGYDWADGGPIFVIQKHAASSLHYDFRIEVDGVLKSWAIPKGPSTDPGEKRLAIPTEDHPLSYANFEGVIPEDNYGAGTVLLWDRGRYDNLKSAEENDDQAASVAEQVNDGHVTIRLHGQKLEGGYALIRTDNGDHERWLLIKMDDDAADARRNPTSTENKSVLSDRSMDEIRQEEAES